MTLLQRPDDDSVGGRPADAVDADAADALPTPMLLSVDRDAGATVLVVSGEVDMATEPLLTAELDRCLAELPASLVLDLTAVTFFGSSGLHTLAAADQSTPPTEAQDATVRPTTVRIAASRAVLQVLELAGLLPVLEVYPTRADALTGTARTGPPRRSVDGGSS